VLLKEFETRVLKRISELTTDELPGGWRKLHTEELSNTYSLLNITNIKSRWLGQ
jgi:hypothetical protein